MPSKFPTRSFRRSCTHVLTVSSLLLTPGLHAGDEIGYVLWTVHETGDIWRARVDGGPATKVVKTTEIEGIATDVADQALYWFAVHATGEPGGLWRSDLDGADRQLLLEAPGMIGLGDLVLDTASDKVYWSERRGGDNVIRRANLDGSNDETILSALAGVGGLALHLSAMPQPRIFYDTDNGIRSANLDGTDVSNVLSVNNIVDLEIDEVHDKLYFSTLNSNAGVRRVDPDGTNVEVLVDTSAASALAIHDSRVYYRVLGGAQSGEIGAVDLDGGNPTAFLATAVSVGDFSLDFVGSRAYITGRLGSRLNRIDLSGANEVPLVAGHLTETHDVAVAPDGTLYFSDFDGQTLVAADFDGGNAVHLRVEQEPFHSIRGIALDPIAGKVYWVDTQSSPDGAIRRMATDGSGLEDLVLGLDNPHDIVVDPVAGKMYWTDNLDDDPSFAGAIRSANLNGTTVSDIVIGLPQRVRGLDLDALNGHLYWADFDNGRILRADLDGANMTPVVSAPRAHDVTVDPAHGKLYWTEGISSSSNPTGKVRRANLDGTGVEDIAIDLPGLIRDLTVTYRPAQIFADGFESGDTSAWTSTVEAPIEPPGWTTDAPCGT